MVQVEIRRTPGDGNDFSAVSKRIESEEGVPPWSHVGEPVSMEDPPDLGTVVPWMKMEGVPIHWHAFLWLSLFFSMSVVSIMTYVCCMLQPGQADSQPTA